MATEVRTADRERPDKEAGRARREAPPEAVARTVRTDFGLSLAMFARMTGVPQGALSKWEQNEADGLDATALGRVGRVAHVLQGLARVIQRTFIPTWIAQPNDACKEVGAGAPLDLFERGDYATLEEMVWYLESGTPS